MATLQEQNAQRLAQISRGPGINQTSRDLINRINTQNTSGQVTQGQNFMRNGVSEGVINFDPNTGRSLNIGESVNASNLAPVTSPLEVPKAPVSTTIPAAQGRIDALTGQTTNALDQYLIDQREAAKIASTKGEGDLSQTMNDILGVQTSRASLQQEQDIAGKRKAADEARKQVTNYNNQLIAEQTALNRQVEALQTRPGATLEQTAPFVAEVQRQSIRKQADLSLLKLTANAALEGANLDLQTAQSIIDDKINVQLEPLKTKLEFQKMFQERNWNRLDSSEKDIITQLREKSQREYDTTKSNLQDANKLWLEAAQNGAKPETLSAIQNAINTGDYDGAKSLSAPYVGVLDREYKKAQISKIYADTKNDRDTKNGLIEAVKANPALFNQLTATDKASIIPTLYNQGFTQFGKPLSDTAVKEISQTQDAISSLSDLRAKILGNEQYIGPIKGLQRLNPYSKARQVQADVDRIRQVVGKALEGGVLRKEDEEKYKKILATLADTPATATYKIDALIGDLTRNLDTYTNNQFLAGKNTGKTQKLTPQSARAKYNY